MQSSLLFLIKLTYRCTVLIRFIVSRVLTARLLTVKAKRLATAILLQIYHLRTTDLNIYPLICFHNYGRDELLMLGWNVLRENIQQSITWTRPDHMTPRFLLTLQFNRQKSAPSTFKNCLIITTYKRVNLENTTFTVSLQQQAVPSSQ